MRLADALAGRRMLLTGVTGFLGQALLYRILADLPETRAAVLVRDRAGAPAEARVRSLLRQSPFDRLGFSMDSLGDRLTVLAGDLGAPPELPPDVDVLVHCAGDVSFDPPIDGAFATNVLGVHALLEAVAPIAPVHYIHISTAFVAGLRRGLARDAAVSHSVDWRVEADAAAEQVRLIDQRSRSADVLAGLERRAARSVHRLGPSAVAAETERLRREWVAEQRVSAGRARARSLGWTDAYTFTKALGERVAEQYAAGLAVSVIRPSIVESALRTPYPGWIDGFKMAEPLILAYGRGELPEFPAVPDTVIDVVPVDLVANAVLAVAAAPPAAGEGPRYFHLSSGARNPLTYRELYEIVQDYFRAHPLEEPGRGAARVPTWSWPGPYSVERLLGVAERAHTLADRAVGRLPRSQRARELARRVDRAGRRLEFFRRYHDLYRPYVQAELVFDDRGTLELHDSMEPADREAFGFDTAVVDWVHYFRDVHCPSVTRVLRELSAGRRARRPHRSARPVPAERPVVAAFDLEGTLLGSNVIESYLWLRLRELDRVGQLRELGTLGRRLPGYLLTERRDRAAFLRASYRSYAGALFAELVRAVEEDVAPLLLSAVSPAGLRRVREHRAAGHHTVLVTGAIEPVTRPLAPLFDRIEAVQLAVDDTGRCTGFLVRPPLVSEARASWLQEVATERQAGLRDCYAYADSHSDLPLLAAVGHPVAVNPDVSLGRHARRRRWPVEDWPAPGGGRRLAPLLSAARGAG